jgi:hypothetical protein
MFDDANSGSDGLNERAVAASTGNKALKLARGTAADYSSVF